MIMRLSILPAILVFAGTAHAADAPIKPAVALDYKIYIGGLEALKATVTIAADSGHYDVEIQAVTAGAVGKMMPWAVNVGSKGNVVDGTLRPISHTQNNNFQGKDRSVTLNYDGQGGFLNRTVVPDANEDQRDPVPPEMTKNTLDIVSGVLEGLRLVDRTGSCNGKAPVFDGRRRFDLIYSDDGHEALESSGVAVYSGDALKCAVKVEPVAA